MYIYLNHIEGRCCCRLASKGLRYGSDRHRFEARGGQAAEPATCAGISPAISRDTATPFDKEGYSLLKFHGIYQGYDRDSATERKQRGDDKVWQFMVRVRIPGGRLTADQYLALDGLADRYADGSLRVTTRQSIQFHGVVKAGLKSAIGEINAALLTTLAACGDVVRTVTTTPAPIRDPVHDRLEAETRRLSNHLLPRTRAYHEIWVDGAPWEPNEGQENADASTSPTRSTASAICRANSRSASRSPRTTRSTC